MLDQSCSELAVIAQLITEELALIRDMRAHGEVPPTVDEARAYSGAMAQLLCMHGPLLIEALDLEMAAALNPA